MKRSYILHIICTHTYTYVYTNTGAKRRHTTQTQHTHKCACKLFTPFITCHIILTMINVMHTVFDSHMTYICNDLQPVRFRHMFISTMCMPQGKDRTSQLIFQYSLITADQLKHCIALCCTA